MCDDCQEDHGWCNCSRDSKDKSKDIEDFLENFPKEAIIGKVERFGMSPLILLDRNKCIKIFIERDGMTPEDAEEFFEFNVIGSWVGDGTPCFATLLE